MRQWRQLIDWCRVRRPTPESVLSSRSAPESMLSLFARGAAGPQGQLPVNVSREGLKEVRERDRLKEDLLKVQDVIADVEQREEALRAEQEQKRLQEEYSQEKAAWENKNRKLEEEAQQLHEE
ncbi:hypothetical protein R1flu_028564 [Riccia fluitans]|uniref:Uncharacterized protein n=1 Tax=Riccia fluitans TaxID=41844 RepID=A0ABD1XPW5_9MARC